MLSVALAKKQDSAVFSSNGILTQTPGRRPMIQFNPDTM